MLGLAEYTATLTSQGYTHIDAVTDITWEDLEEIGITKLGLYLSAVSQESI